MGGKPCHILEQMTKDGELTAFTPALPQGLLVQDLQWKCVGFRASRGLKSSRGLF